ncbi:NAD(P)H-binding protein [Lactobacillus sp. S2-2]|uniref:NAD(P)H-binding protein n=1 Tax=Lactobacillus sp. S2-2 TaxID=2692917 RepID=UPI001F364962|nr:NAD(P)H-binding protein [Lactobacillus sp. S2-2]
MNMLILGGNGAIARLVSEQVTNNEDTKDVNIKLFLRDTKRVDDLTKLSNIESIEGDLDNYDSIVSAMDGQDLIFDATGAAATTERTKNIIKAMQTKGVKRIVSINDLGIYGEVPGEFGRWNAEMLGVHVQYGRDSANLLKKSDLDETTLRLSWLTNNDETDYELTKKGEDFKGTTVSRKSVADVIFKIVKNPSFLINESVGINRPGTDGDRPQY